MSKSHPDARPTYFRLSEASWAQVAEEYRNGATAGELGAKWKVSASSVYRHACKDGWTKKGHSDAVAREHAAAVEAEAEAARWAALGGAGALPGEPWPAGDEDDDEEAFAAGSGATPLPPLSTDPSDLKAATLARLAAAIRTGRDQEALRLTTLVERLSRLSAPEEAPPETPPETPVETPARATDDWRPRRLDPMGYTGHTCVDPIKDPERARLLMTGFVDWRPSPAQVEHEAACMFRSIFLIALCMLLKPHAVPPLLLRRVFRFRRDYLGEDDAEAMRHAERISKGVMREYEQPYRIFLDPERRPIRKLAYRTWPPPRPPYPSRKDLAKEATPLPLAEP